MTSFQPQPGIGTDSGLANVSSGDSPRLPAGERGRRQVRRARKQRPARPVGSCLLQAWQEFKADFLSGFSRGLLKGLQSQDVSRGLSRPGTCTSVLAASSLLPQLRAPGLPAALLCCAGSGPAHRAVGEGEATLHPVHRKHLCILMYPWP